MTEFTRVGTYPRDALPLRKVNCSNCHTILQIDPLWERVVCSDCGYMYTTKQQIIRGDRITDSMEFGNVNFMDFLKSRMDAAKRLTVIQKGFVVIQIIMVCSSLPSSLTKSFWVKLSIRLSAALFGIDGRLWPKFGSKLQFLVPAVMTTLTWFVRAITSTFMEPKPKPSLFRTLWYGSEVQQSWSGLQPYAIEFTQSVAIYIAFTQIYVWLWGNLVGTLRSKLVKIVMAIIVPYFVMPYIAPTLLKQAAKYLLF